VVKATASPFDQAEHETDGDDGEGHNRTSGEQQCGDGGRWFHV
tara:strand:+ start:109 stop:237 length:129 start_codon:yes stop_codon:yes gene_type:complete